MAFDANKELKIEASQAADGSFGLRTAGLAKRDRPELEMTGVPEPALHAAAGVLNLVAAYTVDRAEVLPGQTVGNVLAVGDEGRELLLALRAVTSEASTKPSFWARLSGTKPAKGVLRLLDVDAKTDEAAPPLTALATMLVHRAAVRLAKDDRDGARTELESSLAVLPGDPALASAEPSIDGAGGLLDWQNHLAYADLAQLAEEDGDEDAAREHYEAAIARSSAHARRTIGASSVDAMVGRSATELTEVAAAVLAHNQAAKGLEDGPNDALVLVRSPIWESDVDGSTQRRASLVPRAFLELYYEGPAVVTFAQDGAGLVGAILGGATREQVVRALRLARKTEAIWVTPSAPLVSATQEATDAHRVASRVLADVARCLRAGLDGETIVARYRRSGEASGAEAAALAELEAWELEQITKAMAS